MSEYEQARLDNIKLNQQRLAQLGLGGSTASAALPIPAGAGKRDGGQKRPRKLKEPTQEPAEGSRRSKRTRGVKPDYSKEKIDQFGDELDALAAGRKAGPKPASKQIDTVIGEARELFMKSRESFAAKSSVSTATLASTDGWFKQAFELWGPRVADVKPPSWQKYVLSRMSHVPPPSPYFLLQEIFAPDTWKLLIGCVLMSRVSSADTKQRCIGGFFDRYPTPSAALDADPAEVHPIISGLGLFENRIRSVLAISKKFIEMDEFSVGLEPEVKIYGIGEFGVDSYLIFCQDEGRSLNPNDKNLRGFTTWLKGTGTTKGSVKAEPDKSPDGSPDIDGILDTVAATIKPEPMG